jgi:APA family basic amino acid/polyamine antiporter
MSAFSLTRSLRERDLVAITINAVIGAGIFGLPGKLYALVGPYSLLACVVCAIFVSLVVLCFAEVGSRFRDTGGPYLYARATFGPAVGFQVGWLMWLARVSAFAANSNLLLSYLGGFGAPVQEGLGRSLFITVLVVCLASINVLGIRNAAIVNHAFTIGKLAPIAIFVAVGLFAIVPSRLALGPLPSPASFSTAVLLLVYALTGFEMAAVPGGEMREPQKSLPRALLTAISMIALIYVLIQAVCIGVLPELGVSARPLADASQSFMGTAGSKFIVLGIVVSILGNLHITMLAASRLPFAMAEQEQLPAVFGHTQRRFRSPDVAILATAVIMLAMALMGTFLGALTISTVARLFVYASTCAALPVLRARTSSPAAAFTVRGGIWIAAGALLACAWLLIHSPFGELKPLLVAVIVGLILYGAASYSKRKTY